MVQVEQLEFPPIETHQATGRAQPEIAVPGLSHGVDAIGRQPVLTSPRAAIVLENALSRIQGKPAAGEQEAKKQRARQQQDGRGRRTRLSKGAFDEVRCLTVGRRNTAGRPPRRGAGSRRNCQAGSLTHNPGRVPPIWTLIAQIGTLTLAPQMITMSVPLAFWLAKPLWPAQH